MSKRKGTRYERELINHLWSKGYAVMRSPASGGGTKNPQPDMFVGNASANIYLAIEAKTRATLSPPLKIFREEIEELKKFSEVMGATPLVALRLMRDTCWRLYRIEDLRATERYYYVNKSNFERGIPVDDYLEKIG